MSGFRDRAFYDSSRDHGFWSPSTSAANFCEEDYAISFYMGEFINTLSNLAYIYYALYPPLLSLRARKDVSSQVLSTSMIWDVHVIALMSIGITSAMFHASLQSFPQFLDESSMYFLVAGFAFDLLTTSYSMIPGKHTIIHHHRTVIASGILLTVLTTSTISLWTGDLLIHTFTFAAAIIICGIRMGGLIRKHGKEARSKLYWHLFTADMTLNAGLALWLIDCSPTYCAYLRQFRKQLVIALPPPLGVMLGFLTEFHGWWHILTARAAGEFISMIRYLTKEAPTEAESNELMGKKAK
ncbi:hypothetical protein LTR70_008054 [Exophiala xenobiotica]|uniref:Uncharacterized protein n=1 Tax=Lithohypha guttulata TaxID=1690604 RepID=A0ABR0K4A1_9EURO|nr:hypothetical protein LTR24_007570 [Lithohypha guttulata]KAK5312684.1 hypothetical protein LTR70_008054 [Exophiala xenobiotica]